MRSILETRRRKATRWRHGRIDILLESRAFGFEVPNVVTIRLARHGGKKKPFYHLTVAEKSARRDGRFIERVGFYNPIARGQEEKLRVDLERVDFWLSPGAQPSERVKGLVAQWRKTVAERALAEQALAEQALAEQALAEQALAEQALADSAVEAEPESETAA